MFYVVIYCSCLESTLWMYLTEILNDQIFGISSATFMISLVATSFSFLPAKDYFGIDNCFLFFSFFMLVGVIYSSCCLIETKGADKEEILKRMNAFDWTVVPSTTIHNDIIENHFLVEDHAIKTLDAKENDPIKEEHTSVRNIIEEEKSNDAFIYPHKKYIEEEFEFIQIHK